LPATAGRQRIESDPNGDLARALGAIASACHPLKAFDGRPLGTFAVASTTRNGFADDEVAWLGPITNFLAEPLEGFEGVDWDNRLSLAPIGRRVAAWPRWLPADRSIFRRDCLIPSRQLEPSRKHAVDSNLTMGSPGLR
jgi:hypothetical protein